LPLDDPSKSSFCEPLFISGHNNIEISDEEFSRIGQILLTKRGFNLDAYKDRCVRRRIAIRIRANHCETANEYCELLQSVQGEIDHLLKVLTIHVSQFFRNAPVFEKLRLEIIPQLFASTRQKGAKGLRFWSLGCSSGEEPYTLALILAEYFSLKMKEIPVTIDATDVDAATLDQAKKGIFSVERMLELPLNYLQSYFAEEGTQYRLVPKITDMVNFRQGDLLNDNLYQKCNLLLCRNVLIYFSREQQERIFRNIARVLDRDGFLVLGKSETILGDSRALFKTVCPVERIYRCI
jgi:chemotaxis protein methyltransferase CheR